MTPVSRIIYVGPNVPYTSVLLQLFPGKELKQNRPEDGLPAS